MARNVLSRRNLGIAIVAVLVVSPLAFPAGQSPGAAVPMDGDDIAGWSPARAARRRGFG